MRYLPETGEGELHEDLVRPGIRHGGVGAEADGGIFAGVIDYRRLLYFGYPKSHVRGEMKSILARKSVWGLGIHFR